MSELARLSTALDASERTLRRAADSGLIRADRLSERRLRIPDAERRYLVQHWRLLSGLRSALRTEPNVRLAVLFGSTARGDDGPASDVDVLVQLGSPGRSRMLELEDRLTGSTGRPVDLVRLSDTRDDQMLLSEVIDDGRVLIDRDLLWPGFQEDRDSIRREAERRFTARTVSVLARARRASSG
jgi:predicted nucleotidyltransferase